MIKIKNFIENILSITDYNETHNILRLFGIKIKFPKLEHYKEKLENPYYYYKKNKLDITKVPTATGQIRNIQMANLSLLKELDYVCSQNGLQYWLDFGTLLGAIRHKGFIPWDDDIDVSMIRTDYNKIIDAFNKSSRNPDIYANYVYLGKGQTIIKVLHKKCTSLFLDIFPYEYSNKILTKEEKIKKTKELKQIRQKLSKNSHLTTPNEILSEVKKLQAKIIPDKYVEKSDVQYSLEYFYTEPVWVHSYDTIFPLKRIEFESFSALGINKPIEYLNNIFGDYMAYPKKIGFGHNAYKKLSEEESDLIRYIGGAK